MAKRLLLILGTSVIAVALLAFNSSMIKGYIQRRQFKRTLKAYDIDLGKTDYSIQNYYYEAPFTEFWRYYAVIFESEAPKCLFESPPFHDGLDESAALWVDATDSGMKRKNPSIQTIDYQDAALKSKRIFRNGTDARRYLIIIYDSEKDLYHFIDVSE